jgi:hypothetical protein
MRKATAAKRLAVLKGAAVAGVLATAALATGTANAAVTVINPGTSGTANATLLANAITAANTAGGSNTIVIGTGLFSPTTTLPAITDPNLTITSNHALQSVSAQGPIISGGADTADQPIVSISPGGGLTLEGVDFRAMGVSEGASPGIDVAGTLTAYSSAFQAGFGSSSIRVDTGGTATLTESLVSDNINSAGLDNEGGTLNLNFVTDVRNYVGITSGITNAPGPTNVTNSILASNTGSVGLTNCTTPVTSSSFDVDTDGTCVAAGDTTSLTGTTASPLAQTLGQTKSNGGPTVTIAIPTTATSNPAFGLVPSASCLLTDQRFFIHTAPTGSGCDAGSYQDNGTQDTTPPSCPAPGVIVPNVSQTITLSDTVSGLGPEGGTISDLANVQQSPPITPPAPGNDQADVIDGATISNGMVMMPTDFSPSGPSTSSVSITADKTTVGTLTVWSFYSTNWAGITVFCH